MADRIEENESSEPERYKWKIGYLSKHSSFMEMSFVFLFLFLIFCFLTEDSERWTADQGDRSGSVVMAEEERKKDKTTVRGYIIKVHEIK